MNAIGAHVAGGNNLLPGLAYAETLELEAVQVFLSSPKGWRFPPGDAEQDERFRARALENNYRVFDHASYLANFVSANPGVREGAAQLLPKNLARAARIGAEAVVLHAGSTGGLPREDGYAALREGLLPILDRIPDDGPRVLIEPMAGQGSMICSLAEETEPYLAALDFHPKAGLCLDTCHLLAAGEHLDEPGGTTRMLDSLKASVGLDRIGLIHANDSKAPRGGKKDRHENLGSGHLGTYCFPELFGYEGLAVPFILETPSVNYAGDLEVLRADRAKSR